MDLFALTLIASSVLALFGAILAGFIFAPWVMAFGALGLLALLPRITNEDPVEQSSSTPINGSKGTGLNVYQGVHPSNPRVPTQTTGRSATTLRYRGGVYRSAVDSGTTAVKEPASSDR